MGGPCCSSSFSTISIARSTPAQNERGAARRTRLLTHPRPRGGGEGVEGTLPVETGAQESDRRAREPARDPGPVVRAFRLDGVADPVQPALRRVADGAEDAAQAAAPREHPALEIDRVRARPLVELAPLGRVVDDPLRR